MKASILFVAILTAVLNNISVRGGDFDGTKPMICALNQVVVCEQNGEIAKETPASVNLPQFFFIDVGNKSVTAKGPSGDTRQTSIENTKRENGTLILQGVQLGKAWHAVINEETGKATITGATDDTAFVVFAACTLNTPPAPLVKEAAGAEKNKKAE